MQEKSEQQFKIISLHLLLHENSPFLPKKQRICQKRAALDKRRWLRGTGDAVLPKSSPEKYPTVPPRLRKAFSKPNKKHSSNDGCFKALPV